MNRDGDELLDATTSLLGALLAILDTLASIARDMHPPRLPELVPELVRSGVAHVTVVPVFLGQGGHVLRDLPLIIDQLRVDHPGVEIQVAEAVGENAAVLNAISDYCISALGR